MNNDICTVDVKHGREKSPSDLSPFSFASRALWFYELELTCPSPHVSVVLLNRTAFYSLSFSLSLSLPCMSVENACKQQSALTEAGIEQRRGGPEQTRRPPNASQGTSLNTSFVPPSIKYWMRDDVNGSRTDSLTGSVQPSQREWCSDAMFLDKYLPSSCSRMRLIVAIIGLLVVHSEPT